MMDNQEDSQNFKGKDFFAKIDSPEEETKVDLGIQKPSEEIPPQVSPPFVSEAPASPTFPMPESVPPEMDTGGRGNLKKILLLVAGVLLIFGFFFFIISKIIPQFKKGEEVTLSYWGLWEPSSVMNQIIADYQKTHPKVKINYLQQSPKEYRERLQSALARGEGPDIFRFHNTWVPMIKNDLAPIPASIMDAATFERLFYPVARTDLRFGNSYLGIPLEIDTLALFYNEEIFNTAGKSPPKTWDEFRKVALELTVKDASGKIQTAGAALGITNNIDHWSEILGLMLLQNGADLSNPTTNLAEDALSFFSIFSRSDRVWDETLPSSTYYFASGRLAMYFGPSWRVFDIKALNPSLKFKVISVPQLPGANLGWATYWVEGVSKKSPNLNQAWEFLKYLSSKETLEKLYQEESKLRLFGEAYSRTDMAESLRKEPYVGAFIEQASMAKSWYLCSRTFDNGINDKIIKYYEDAVNAVNKGQSIKSALATVAQGVTQVLGQYGVK